LGGWTDKGVSLEVSFAVFVNGFYFEIVNQLKEFFEDKALSSLKVPLYHQQHHFPLSPPAESLWW
jgi:hypothetical protein